MKILLLGEYSNVHNTLAKGLRQQGHQVTVISNGDFWKNYPRNIDVSRPSGRLAGLRLYARVVSLLPRMTGYDIVQIINPMFFELKAERLFFFYRWLRRHNGKIVLGAFGMDWYWVHECTFSKPLRYSDFNIGQQLRTDEPALREQRDWLGTAKERLNHMIAADCDAIVSGLYENYVCYEPHYPLKTHFIPFPIVMPAQKCPADATKGSQSAPLRIFIGISRGRSAYKGTDVMLRAAQDVVRQYPDRAILQVAEGIPFDCYQQMLDNSDVLLDQLYSYTPAMNALLAMSKGIIVVGGGEPENYEIIHETELRPIVNVEPSYERVASALEQLILSSPQHIALLKEQSRQYVRRHHEYVKVARQYQQLYQGL